MAVDCCLLELDWTDWRRLDGPKLPQNALLFLNLGLSDSSADKRDGLID